LQTLDDDWDLSPETAHPDAARLLKEPFYWDLRDESAPFGNDSGAQTLQFYRAALAEDDELDAAGFLDDLLQEWDIDGDFAAGIPDDELAQRLEREQIHILTYDDVVVALAFAELVFQGKASVEMSEAAIRSLERQAMPEVLEFRGWSDPAERQARCEQMIAVLRESL
jgi:uncharacterized protein YfeS